MLGIGALRLAAIFMIALALTSACCTTSFAASSGVIRFAGDFTSAPALYFNENHDMRGADYELCSRVAEKLGMKAVWTNTAFGGLIPALSAERVDAVCSAMYITPERSEVLTFVPYRRAGHGGMVAKGNPHNIADLGDACGLSVVEVLGTVYERMVKEQSRACVRVGKGAIDLKTFATAADVAEQLLDGRADVWLAGDTILDYYLSKNQGALQKAFSRKDLTLIAIGVAPRRLALAQAFSVALKKMRADGSYQAIFKKYGIAQEEISTYTVHTAIPRR